MLQLTKFEWHMKFAHCLILSQVLVFCFSGVSMAQAQTTGVTEAQKKDFTRKIKNTIFGSCNRTAGIEDPRERSQSCTCYSKAYVDKFTFPTHVAINNWAAQNPKRGIISPLMMEQEMKKCGIKWSTGS